jgi:hypothetical protein
MDALALTLTVLGAGFLVANARLILDQIRFVRRRRSALLVWPGPRPPYYGTVLALAVVLGLVALYKLFVLRRQVFGEAMMFLYYGYLLPFSVRIRRGFYEDGVWTDTGFVPYREIGGVSWRESERQVTLVVISRMRNLARRLAVPLEDYGAARRLLRDRITQHDVRFAGTGLDLVDRDFRSDV